MTTELNAPCIICEQPTGEGEGTMVLPRYNTVVHVACFDNSGHFWKVVVNKIDRTQGDKEAESN